MLSPFDDLPEDVQLVTEPMVQVEIAEASCIPIDMDQADYLCWMDALEAARLN
jgi:hypothetical protein